MMALKPPLQVALLLACLLCCGTQLADTASARRASKHGLRKVEGLSEADMFYNHKPVPVRKEEDMPADFDWCKMGYCTASWNQHIPDYCGSCYLHASLSMIQDRLKIAKQGHSPDVLLGRQSFLNCAPRKGFSDGCGGGDVIDVFRYMTKHGLPDDSCMPYSATDYRNLDMVNKHHHHHHHEDRCEAQDVCMNCMPGDEEEGGSGKNVCWAVEQPILYTLSSYGKVGAPKPEPGNMEAMMSEIMARGPISCSIACPDELVYGYDGGIYNDTTHDKDVDHDIEIVGWGVENGVKYWNIRNSWGSYWGQNSFFRVMRGVNALQLEAGDCWYAIPEFDMEKEVEDGSLVGSMYGLHDKGTPSPWPNDKGRASQQSQKSSEDTESLLPRSGNRKIIGPF